MKGNFLVIPGRELSTHEMLRRIRADVMNWGRIDEGDAEYHSDCVFVGSESLEDADDSGGGRNARLAALYNDWRGWSDVRDVFSGSGLYVSCRVSRLLEDLEYRAIRRYMAACVWEARRQKKEVYRG